MKKIMILGAGVYQLPILQKAADMCEVILVAPAVSQDCKEYADKVYYMDLRQQDEILEIAQKEKIDGIITDQTDIPVRTVAYVADHMGLPGIGYDTACLFTDKGKMRQKLEELGIPVLPNKTVQTLEEAFGFFESLQGAAIIKPADNQGSRGVYKISSKMELEKYFDSSLRVSPTGQVVIEKYAEGREFVVEAMSLNHEYQELILGDTIYFDIENAFAAKNRIFPSNASEEIYKKVSLLNERIIKGFGLKQGISHSEYVMDGDEVYLIETAARGGGVFISSDLIHLGAGVNTEEFLIRIALGELSAMPKVQKDQCHCGYMAFYLPQGTVKSIQGIETIQNYDFVHRNILYTIHTGMQIGTIEDKTSRFSIIVSGKSAEELEEHMEQIRKALLIEVDTEEGVKYPIWE
ncbi:MAG: ATP-grasp domain-containing protein [Eubacterium sp.]|nr:ATP-grasp domain-containing protein [Eubacterium sp.]